MKFDFYLDFNIIKSWDRDGTSRMKDVAEILAKLSLPAAGPWTYTCHPRIFLFSGKICSDLQKKNFPG